MARRSDHSRAELASLIVSTGHALMAEAGFHRFSAREIAKRIGYSIGTLYNVFDNFDQLILAINGETLTRLATRLRIDLNNAPGDRIEAMVYSYLKFAEDNPNCWLALQDHRLPAGDGRPEWYRARIADIADIVGEEISSVLPSSAGYDAASLTLSLQAILDGHCLHMLTDKIRFDGKAMHTAALSRVRETILVTIARAELSASAHPPSA